MNTQLNEMGIITVTKVSFYNGKNKVNATDGVHSVLLNGKFHSKGVDIGYANVFIEADEYNSRIAGHSIADTIQVLCMGESTETKKSVAGKTYIQVNIDDNGVKVIKVTECADEMIRAFTDEVRPFVTIAERKEAKAALSV